MRPLFSSLRANSGAGALGLLLGIPFLAAPASAQSTIDTRPDGWTTDNTQRVQPLGESQYNIFGQTFTVGEDRYLNSFTFWVSKEYGAAVTFRAYIAEWDDINSTITGPDLFESDNRAASQQEIMEEFSFASPSLELVTGRRYVAYLNTFPLHDGRDSYASMAFAGSDQYSGGTFVYLQQGSAADYLSTDRGALSEDAAFVANFSATPASTPAVPETDTGLLLMAGLSLMAGMAVVRQRRSRS